ncbi:MAG: hypothetical protein GJ680_01290 [Alteromonadaceae bacterium]|nr:hypothetical protein [Alteromonadaceae bacterium]
MFIKLATCLRRIIYLLLLGFVAPAIWAGETEDFVAVLKTHYEDTLEINAFTLKYHFLNRRYRVLNYWDFQAPNLYMSQRMVEVDLAKKHFYDNDILYYAGGRLFDRVQFQNDDESIFYEKSATSLGRMTLRRGLDNFDRFKSHMLTNIDFLVVRPIFDEENTADNMSLLRDVESDTTTLVHTITDEQVVEYTFQNNPIRLVRINHGPLNGVFHYGDYQTTRGFTYARNIVKYYDGETKPTYIKYIDDFTEIAKVDPSRLKVPEGYGPEYQRGDGILVAREIAKELYLVTDSSAARNSLLKIIDDEIMVFGAAVSKGIAEKTLKLIGKQFPGKKVTSIYVTHPHLNQIAGLDVFAENGVEILADEYTISGIKASSGFSETIAKFRFRTITHGESIAGATFYVLENMHSKRQSFVHFKDEDIIFQSNLMHIPYDNTIAKVVPNYTKTFIDFIRSEKLNFNRIVGNYRNNNISVGVVNKTYEARL